jgi:hypothetical protein
MAWEVSRRAPGVKNAGVEAAVSAALHKFAPSLRVCGRHARLYIKNPGMRSALHGAMRRIKLSGRERAVLKALGFAEPVPGEEIREYTQIQPDDLTDVLNALLAAGYVESKPYREQITSAEMPMVEFEVNPGYVHELKISMARSWA